MSMKLALYRKYRPQTFDEVVGQDHVARTLRNAVATNSVAHAYVFAGPRGIGKTSMAKILAKALNCVGTNPDGTPVTGPTVTPCGVCEECQAIAAGTSLDVIEMDAASNRGIDDIREIRDKVAYAPVHGRSKVYIIDEVHMLTEPAFNALLKTLEEPPPHVVFVLATTEAHKIPMTILSRCQRFDFQRPRVAQIRELLQRIATSEKIEIEEMALTEIALHAEGSFRDAIGVLEQVATFYEGQQVTTRDVLDILGAIEHDLLVEVTDTVIDRDAAAALLFVQRLAERGPNYAQFIRDLMRYLRQLFILQHVDADSPEVAATLDQSLGLATEHIGRAQEQANQLQPAELLRFLENLGQAQTEIRAGLDARLQLELALVKVTKPHVDLSPGGLEERLRRLEAAVQALAASRPLSHAGPTTAQDSTASPASKTRDTRAASAAAATTGASVMVSAPAPAAARTAAGAGAKRADVGAGGPSASTGAAGAGTGSASADTGSVGADADASTAPAGADAGPSGRQSAPAGATAANAAQTAPAPLPGDTLERVKRSWNTILQQIESRSVPLYAALKDARPTALTGTTLTLTMPSEFALTKAAEPAHKVLLGQTLQGVIGGSVSCEFTLARAPAPETNPAPPPNLSLAERIALVEKTLDARQLPDDE